MDWDSFAARAVQESNDPAGAVRDGFHVWVAQAYRE